jgi:hypothetical protein
MTVFCVEYICADSHYGYNLERVFSTLERCEVYIASQKSYMWTQYRVVERMVDSEWEHCHVLELTRLD